MNKIQFKSIKEYYNFLEKDQKNIYIDFYRLFPLLHILSEKKRKEASTEIQKIQYEKDCAGFRIINGNLNQINYTRNFPNLESFKYDELNYFEKRLKSSSNPFVKTQYSTILWKSSSKHQKYVKIAIDSFLEKENICEILDQENLSESYGLGVLESIKNAFYLACESKYKRKEVKVEIKRLLLNYSYESNISYTLRINLIQLMLDKKRIFHKENFKGLDEICWGIYQRIKNEGDYQQAISVLDIGSKVAIKLQKDAITWNENIAKCYEELMNREREGCFIALVYCQNAIQIYKKLSKEEKVKELLDKYNILREQTALKESYIKIDLPEYLKNIKNSEEKAEKLIKKTSGNDILKVLTYDDSILPKYSDLDKIAEEKANRSIFSQFSTEFTADKMGNIFQKLSEEDEKKDDRIIQSYERYLQLLKLPLINKIFLKAIINGKLSTEIIINYFRKNSWFGKRYIKKRFSRKIECDWIKLIIPVFWEYFNQINLQLGFPDYQPNFVLCIDSITVKIEGLIRDLCYFSNSEIATTLTTRNKEGKISTEESDLNRILHNPELLTLFNKDEILFFKFLLTEKAGYNLRNEVAHSLLQPDEYTLDKVHLLFLALLKIGKHNIVIKDNLKDKTRK